MSSKAKLGVLILLMVVIAIGVGVFTDSSELRDASTQPEQNGTSTIPTSTEQTQTPEGWETYSNAQLDVTASYPPNASVGTEGPQNRHINFTYLGEDNATGEITDGFTLTVSDYNKESGTSLREFVEQKINNNIPARPTSDIATTSFRQQTAYQWTREALGTVKKLAVSPSSDRAVIVSYNISDPNNNNYQNIVDKIISSLDFSPVSSDDNQEAAGTTEEVTLVMLNTEVPEGQEPQRGCDMLAPITRRVSPTQTPLTQAMEELFATDRTEVQGFYNFIAKTNDSLQFDRAAVEDGTANIYLTGELSGFSGACDNPRAAIQIEETAKQFSTIEGVQLFLNGEKTDLSPSGR
jgi:hypothetical protein